MNILISKIIQKSFTYYCFLQYSTSNNFKPVNQPQHLAYQQAINVKSSTKNSQAKILILNPISYLIQERQSPQNSQPPSLLSIYRKYLKSSIKIYNQCDITIGRYLLRLLDKRKLELENQLRNIQAIQELINQIKKQDVNKNVEKETVGQQKKQLKIQNQKRLFKKSPSLSQQFPFPHSHSQQLLLTKLLKLDLQKSNRQRFLRQKLLYNFQILHFYGTILQQCSNPSTTIDTRTNQQLKLLYLSLNISKYFIPTLSFRPQYHSLYLIECLQDDMEYEALSQKDKGFVKEVIEKVCGKRNSNYSRFRSVINYLKDENSAQFQSKSRFLIKGSRQENRQNKTQTIKQGQGNRFTTKRKQKADDQEQDHINQQWSLISEQQRNQCVRKLFKDAEMSLFERKTYILEKRQNIKTNNNKLPNLNSSIAQAKTTQQQQQQNSQQNKNQQTLEQNQFDSNHKQHPDQQSFLEFFQILKQSLPQKPYNNQIRSQLASLSKRLVRLQQPSISTTSILKNQQQQKIHYKPHRSSAGDGISSSNRFFRVQTNPIQKKEQNNFSKQQQQSLKHDNPKKRYLNDLIIENDIFDEIINKKRCIIV